jgi:hypothetical protein
MGVFMNKTILNQEGLSIFNVLAMVATATALLFTTAGYHKDNAIIRKSALKTATRDNLNASLAQYATAPSSIRNSMKDPENEQLKNCVTGIGSCVCDKVYPLKLIGPFADSPVIADSTEKSGAKFDIFGHPCENNYTVKCPFEVVVSFAKSCSSSEIKVNYQVNEAIFSGNNKITVSPSAVTTAIMPTAAILATGINYEKIYVATGGTMDTNKVVDGVVTNDPTVQITGSPTGNTSMNGAY